ncbi:glycerol kinase [Flexivirga caeni]|uniref:glycerol kinase n=2 Tax=Flexivirga caeni TaxID=2294115 RepID=A0A3M9MBE7_9MICO|nr:glycerol kinase [Flexivirga caeni]
MTSGFVASIDQGTTSTRCVVFDAHGRMVALSQQEHRQFYPQPGWVEHDAAEIWELVRVLLPEAIRDAGIDPSQVSALGITNQRETAVVWDRHTGKPVHRAIVWQDTRTSGLLPRYAAQAAFITDRTGLPLSNYSSAPKLRWLFDHHPELAGPARAGDLLFGTMDSWLVWNLTGGVAGGRHVTDVTNASRTMLMNLDTLDWDEDLLAIFGLPRQLLPEIVPSICDVGTVADPVPGLRVTALIGDQQASLFGQTTLDAGEAKCTFGTGSFLLFNTGTQPVRTDGGLITTVAHQQQGQPAVYALEGSMAVAGALVKWCRDNLGLIRSVAEIETQASTVTDNGGCYIVPAFAGLYAPHWDSNARGLIVGLTGFVTKGHLCRAVLESTAWQTRDVVEAMNRHAPVPVSRLMVDGGMTADNLLMQILSDALNVPVLRPMVAETVALGAAYAAGIGAGVWPDRRALRQHWHLAGEWTPNWNDRDRETACAGWQHAVDAAIYWGRRTGDEV